jgi:RimJ/RimL family protein N-acetyltransferase
VDRQTLIAAPRELRSQRLLLQSPRVEHAGAFLESLNRSIPGLAFITWGQQQQDPAWAERFCLGGQQMVEEGECLVFNAFLHGSGVYAGRIDLHTFDFEAPRCEIGYVGDAALQGQGLMREAALAVIAFGFALGLARIHALSDARNTRALQFARALGMQHEGQLRAYERDPQGALCEMAMFAAYNPAAR